MAETSWLVPEVRVGDISLPEIRQCDVDEDDDETVASEAGPPLGVEHHDEAHSLVTGSPNSAQHQPKWFVMASDADVGADTQQLDVADASDARLLGFDMRGNLPREGALQLSVAAPQPAQSAGLGATLLAVPWQVPRRRHSWICRYLYCYTVHLNLNLEPIDC